MSKLWHTQVILLLSGERPLVHRGSKDKVQSQHLESLGTGALSAYFATNFITRLFSQSGAATRLMRGPSRGMCSLCPGRAIALRRKRLEHPLN